MTTSIHEQAFAKLNLVLHVGRRRPDGMHPLASIFASIDLHDDVLVEAAGEAPAGEARADAVHCPGVPAPNLAEAALGAYRARVPDLPPLQVTIEKRIPVAAGLGGGSADAAAVLRAANRIAGDALGADALRELGAGLGSDVPSQIDPRHELVTGVGEVVEPLELPHFAALLVPQAEGLSTASVYETFDRLGGGRTELAPDLLREIPQDMQLAPVLANDLQPAALALRPELADVLDALRGAGALAAAVSGSGPTCFGLFEDRAAAEAAAGVLAGSATAAPIVAELRHV